MTPYSEKRFCWLDWFRFLAAFEVMAFHVRGHLWVHYAQLQADGRNWLAWIFFAGTHCGGEAVTLFFVLSGFLVGGKVLERSLAGSFDLKAYAMDRVSRIYVPLIPVLVFSGIAGYLLGGQPVSLSTGLGNLAGLQSVCVHAYGGNLPLWSLAYEIWFYVLGGFVAVLLCGRGPAKTISLFGIMFVLVLFTRLQPWLLFCWIIGACGYLLVLAEDITPLFSLTGAVLAISGLIYSQYISAHPRSFGNFLSSGHVAEMIFSLGMAVVFAFVSKRVPHSKPMLRFERAGGKLAAFSYTLYLTHFPVVSLWSKFGPEKFAALSVHAFLWFIAECVACLLFAFVFYLPFEAQTARVRALLKRSAPGHNRAVKREEQLVRGPATAADLAQGEK